MALVGGKLPPLHHHLALFLALTLGRVDRSKSLLEITLGVGGNLQRKIKFGTFQIQIDTKVTHNSSKALHLLGCRITGVRSIFDEFLGVLCGAAADTDTEPFVQNQC
tara:strand:- start:336 stop:656 length:321 start_codon:yes stop_codon:yes gene_type:complete